jgi:hypothetical protein
MRAFEPEILVPGHGPVVRGEDVTTLLNDLEAYAAFVLGIAAEEHACNPWNR